jgi:autotransporter-associated beta strand protein
MKSLLSPRSFHNKNNQSPLRSRARAFLVTAAAILPLLLSTASTSSAASATWLASPTSGDWDTAANWTVGGPPNGAGDTATFVSSSITGITLSHNTEVNGITFNTGASAFTIHASDGFMFTISGVGITNNSTNPQTLTADSGAIGGVTAFSNSATAGNLLITNAGDASSTSIAGATDFLNTATAGSATITNQAATASTTNQSVTAFFNSSTAGSASITNNGGALSGNPGGSIAFFDTSTAGTATIINNGGAVSGALGATMLFTSSASGGSGTFTSNGGAVSGASGGSISFQQTSTAGTGTFNISGAALHGARGGQLTFGDTSTADTATLIANAGGGGGGLIQFGQDSTGGTASVQVISNGTLDISGHNAPGLTIGSITGSGVVSLGANNLTVGASNLSTAFAGKIQDGGLGGSLTKVGTGNLSLSKASSYTGGTTVSAGTLRVTNRNGSATGTGTVQVNAGTLSGLGIIGGAVNVGTGTGTGAVILAGNSSTAPGILTVNGAVTLNADSSYVCVLNRRTPTMGEITALGVTINSGASFVFVDVGNTALTVGTVFTVINNTSANPIFGTFSNLANGAVFTSHGNSFQASYTGGTGNDLTLTVTQ